MPELERKSLPAYVFCESCDTLRDFKVDAETQEIVCGDCGHIVATFAEEL